jgi:hypothetical protein
MAMWLNPPQIGNVVRCHVLNQRELLVPIEASRLESIHRLIGTQVARQIDVAPEHAASSAVHKEERWTRAFALNFHSDVRQ